MAVISIIVPTFNGAAYLEETLESVWAQTFGDWELLLFDDGSSDASRAISEQHAVRDPSRVRCLAHAGNRNLGQFATRIAGARAARSELIAFLDQDDIWDPRYLDMHLARWQSLERDGVRLSYGPGLYWHTDDHGRDFVQPMPPGTPGSFDAPTLLMDFFQDVFAATPLPSCTFLHRAVLEGADRFSGIARGSQCEDQYLSWYVAARFRIAIHADAWVRYRVHSESALARMPAAPARQAELTFLETMLGEIGAMHPSHPLLTSGRIEARMRALFPFAPYGPDPLAPSVPAAGSCTQPEQPPQVHAKVCAHPAPAPPRGERLLQRTRAVAASLRARVRLGVGVRPLSEEFGSDRGLALLRYYSEQFLAEHAADVRGSCLEFEEAHYTLRYGRDSVHRSEVLHLDDSNPRATLIADLTQPNGLASDQFDCILCTFVLHEIFDLPRAVSELHRILKPRGVLLVAVPHVSMCEPKFNELWRFTVQGLDELLAGAFTRDQVVVRAYGNSLTAAGQIRGLAAHEFTKAELDFHDHRFAVAICARAVKRGSAPADTQSW